MNNYEMTIGLEVHIQLKTNSKIWCSSSANYDNELPNTCISPVNTGQPGALPSLNKEVVNSAILAALTLNCDINEYSRFDRKNYFYPDSPKNYQITQYFKPYAENGYITLSNGKNIGIERIQIEEDTAKAIHLGNNSYLNFNRASMPLLEIISKPEIKTPQEAYEYLTILKERIKYTKISDVSMELGSLRCDVNVSLKEKDSKKLGTRTETKNLNSFKAVVKAIEYEVNRQMELISKGEKIVQETRMWDEETGTTKSMRSKEEAMDYRYFPEPDLPPLIINRELIEEIKLKVPEFGSEKCERYIKEYGLGEMEAKTLTNSLELAIYFENLVKLTNDPKISSNWILTEVLRVLKDKNIEISEFNISEESLAKLIGFIKDSTISGKIAKDVFEKMVLENKEAEIIIKENNLVQIVDNDFIANIVKEIIENNRETAIEYKNGKERNLKFLMGQAMKLSKGKANPQLITQEINKQIGELVE